MSFTNVGPVTTIVPGISIFWTYSYGRDAGFQHAGADIKTANAELVAFDQGKFLDLRGSVIYNVTIRNNGGDPCDHNLQGGGAS